MTNHTPYIETFTGTKFTFLDPQIDQISIKDIAFSLSNQCRFNGHVPFFSVAEHSVAVASRLPPRLQMAGLLHDAAEAYLSDIPSPIKAHMPEYVAMENKVQDVVNERFNIVLTAEDKAEVKYADQDATHTEAHYLLESEGRDWLPVLFQPQEKYRPRGLTPVESTRLFMYWFHELNKTFEEKLVMV
jgi:hypothetical protein